MTSDSLLAHLAWRFPGTNEDVATEALCYILCKQESARTALAGLLRSGGADPEQMDSFDTQRVYQRSKKPDLVAFNEGREVLLVESKFWAALTPNQPNGYLKLMMDDLPDARNLLFIAPDASQDWLWNQLCGRAKGLQLTGEQATDGVLSVAVGSDGHRLMLTSWDTLLHRLTRDGAEEDDNLQQLRGLCALASDPPPDASSDVEELSEIDHYKAFLRDATALAQSKGIIDTKGLSYGGPGYGRYFHFMNAGGERFAAAYAWVGFNFARTEAPFSLFFLSTGSDANLEEVNAQMAGELDKDGHVSIPISATAGYAYVREEVVGKLKEIRERIAVSG
ncbi:MAG: hypothetical protein F4045_03145 [Chloroflexi bacterium]|nr:hypothetical protein [Chloroflexota bacterium]MYK34119.1 hypothetical protein [Chloroflexota bacterium]